MLLRTADHFALLLARDDELLHQMTDGITAPRKQPLRADERTHMKIGQMMESKYLKQSDVDEETQVTVQGLKKVNVARDDEEPEYRWTVKFHEFDKPMVLNATNIKRMGKALGDDTDDWIGNSVILYVDPDIEFGGNVVGGLRIKGLPRPKTAGKRPADNDNDVPF